MIESLVAFTLLTTFDYPTLGPPPGQCPNLVGEVRLSVQDPSKRQGLIQAMDEVDPTDPWESLEPFLEELDPRERHSAVRYLAIGLAHRSFKQAALHRLSDWRSVDHPVDRLLGGALYAAMILHGSARRDEVIIARDTMDDLMGLYESVAGGLAPAKRAEVALKLADLWMVLAKPRYAYPLYSDALEGIRQGDRTVTSLPGAGMMLRRPPRLGAGLVSRGVVLEHAIFWDVDFHVDKKGRPRAMSHIGGNGSSRLNRPARLALEYARFRPGFDERGPTESNRRPSRFVVYGTCQAYRALDAALPEERMLVCYDD